MSIVSKVTCKNNRSKYYIRHKQIKYFLFLILFFLCGSILGCESNPAKPNPESSIIKTQDTSLRYGYLLIKFKDNSEIKLYNWSFLYRFADYEDPPPSGFQYSADTEKTNDNLILQEKTTKIKAFININEIDRFEMTWELGPLANDFERKSIILYEVNKDKMDLTDLFHCLGLYEIDMSVLTTKKYTSNNYGCAYIYVAGNESRNLDSRMIKFPLFLDSSVLFEQEGYPSVPLQILVVREK